MNDHPVIFEQHRNDLQRVAYQMVGSVSEAKDLVQDTYLRWQDVEISEVDNPRSYLTTIVTRLCIDHMRSARVKREKYTGPWLPEPIAGDTYFAPDQQVELKDSLSTAFLVMLEALNPVERAVFLLREIFDYEYEEVAEIVDKSVVNCRKIASRARKQIEKEPSRFDVSPEKQEVLVRRFMEAIEGEDMDALLDILEEDIVLYSDGGEKVPHALDPIDGARRVSRFLVGLEQNAPENLRVNPATINGQPGFIGYQDGHVQSVISLEITGDRIQNIFIVVNPEKLEHLTTAPTGGS
jgi:RNA polymerase sigma-70 factor (ECF subfamily)